MPYTNYPVDLEQQESLNYVIVDNLRALLKNLDGIQFALQSQRTQGLQLLAGLDTITNFFSNTVRFPEIANGRRFATICLDKDDWPFKFEQVSSALNYKVPDISQTNKDLSDNASNFQQNQTNNNKIKSGDNNSSQDDAMKCITSQNERTRFEKALKSYTTGLADIKKQIMASTITRRFFENKYALIWAWPHSGVPMNLRTFSGVITRGTRRRDFQRRFIMSDNGTGYDYFDDRNANNVIVIVTTDPNYNFPQDDEYIYYAYLSLADRRHYMVYRVINDNQNVDQIPVFIRQLEEERPTGIDDDFLDIDIRESMDA